MCVCVIMACRQTITTTGKRSHIPTLLLGCKTTDIIPWREKEQREREEEEEEKEEWRTNEQRNDVPARIKVTANYLYSGSG